MGKPEVLLNIISDDLGLGGVVQANTGPLQYHAHAPGDGIGQADTPFPRSLATLAFTWSQMALTTSMCL